ncbi:hypothetical protein [Myxacorys almedinensis]|uniref:Uncharacterized protein n=1 Tax=Myxacorys almedinensis A TaxID=2690445 RepID=A0A8J7Z1L1_9CYAN|nr:hypothetical protein [Myxacorys almedinensis]NDJ18397.1 hypothetical protein [Myxacorys almedinensis A]
MARVLPSTPPLFRRKNLWFERAMAIAALTNLGLVIFDITYLPWRDFWFRTAPAVVQQYDRVKGIEPHRDTDGYLASVQQLERALQQGGLQSALVQTQLQELRDRSDDLIQSNPFSTANKSGTLEKIKNRMRDRVVGQRRTGSSRQAFATFWSREYLAQKGVDSELTFFNTDIRPLFATNYYRSIGENGEFTDWFWLLDAPFMVLFGLEFLARTSYLSRFNRLTRLDAMLWRWYDLFLLLPFWRWLRLIPTLVRLEHARFINLTRLRVQASRGFVANISEDMAEVVVVQVINRLKDAIARGEMIRWLLETANRPYIDLNQRDELQDLATHVLQATVYGVLPKIKPDLEALMRHTIEMILNQSPAYQALKALPMVGDLPRQINERLVTEVTQGLYSAIVTALEDQAGAALISSLVKNFGQTLATELQREQSIRELQTLAIDLLEEIKVNYVRRPSEEDVEAILEATRRIGHRSRI